MNHDEADQLLSAYHDGELDLATSLKLEAHLSGCVACQEKLKGQRELTALIQAETPRFRPSPFIATRILANVRASQAALSSHSYSSKGWLGYIYPTLALGLIFGLVLAAVIYLNANSAVPEVAQEAVDDHIRSLQVNHLMDVVSTDQHTVKPWFAGRLEYSPPVIDLTSAGYPLVGGRLDILEHRYVAAILYQKRLHYINLFEWPSDHKSLDGKLYNLNTYHAIGWTKSGMNYLAVSELGTQELKDFTELIQAKTVESRTGE